MQAVILAAGKGTRMGALTAETPKVMLKVAGKTLLEHKFDALPESVDEIILVVGYLGHTIQAAFGGEYNGKKVLYVEQETLDGTGGALWRVRPILHDRFLVMYGDDIYARADIRAMSACAEWSVAGLKMNSLGSAAKIIIDDVGTIRNIVEREEHDGGEGYVNTGLYTFDTRVFDFPLLPKSAGSDEYGLPQTVLAASLEGKIPFKLVEATQWMQITAPEDLEKAEAMLAAER